MVNAFSQMTTTLLGLVAGAPAPTSAPSGVLGSAWRELWFPPESSTVARDADNIFFFIFWVSAFFFVVLMLAMVWFAYKYRRRPGLAPEPSPSHNTLLELTWSVIPFILMAVMFFWGFRVYMKMRVAPSDAETITVRAWQWGWEFVYPGGIVSSEVDRVADRDVPVFALPVGRPVKFLMYSDDVIHAFYIPAFRTKQDIWPNRYSTTWVEVTKPTHEMVLGPDGKYTEKALPGYEDDGGTKLYLFCAEYCGDSHSQMAARIKLMEPASYKAWLDKQADTSGIPLIELGGILRKTKGCVACHSVDGSTGTGPTWKDAWGTPVDLEDGSKAAYDETYVANSIRNPASQIHKGFANQMAPYDETKINARELQAITTYIKSLTESAKAEAEAFSAEEIEKRNAEKNAGGAAPPTP